MTSSRFFSFSFFFFFFFISWECRFTGNITPSFPEPYYSKVVLYLDNRTHFSIHVLNTENRLVLASNQYIRTQQEKRATFLRSKCYFVILVICVSINSFSNLRENLYSFVPYVPEVLSIVIISLLHFSMGN